MPDYVYKNDWERGYTYASRDITFDRTRLGWARGKGVIKSEIRSAIQRGAFSAWYGGYIDAMLDSVGC